MKERLGKTRRKELRWEVDEAEILEQLGYDSRDHLFIIDMKPSVPGNVSLYRLRRIWGFSNPDWTPLALRLDALFVDEKQAHPEKFKSEFLLPSRPDAVHEFLYVRGGTRGGTWNWGRIGSVNGVLLWPRELKHFLTVLSE